jgi:cobaltochelatase CobT
MPLNQFEFQRYIAASANRANLCVKWKNGAVPSTNGKEIILPTLDKDATEAAYRELIHYVNHEVDHILYTDSAGMSKTGISANTSLLGAIWNVLEDVRIEWLGGQDYEGDRRTADAVFPNLMRGPIEGMKTRNPKNEKLTDDVGPLLAAFCTAQEDNYASATAIIPDVEAALTPTAHKRWDKMKKANYLDELARIKHITDPVAGSRACLDLAKRIFKDIYEQDPEKEIERLAEQAKNDKSRKWQGESSPTPDKGAGKGKEGDKAAEGKGEGGKLEGGEGTERKEHQTVDYSGVLPNQHGNSKHGQHLDYSKYSGTENIKPATKDEMTVVDFEKQTTTSHTMKRAISFTKRPEDYAPMCRTILAENSKQAFAARVRTRLQIRSKDRFEYGTRTGKISAANLYRGALDKCPGLNERVFKRRIVNDTLDTCVTWLIDSSGSMGGSKYTNAAAATALVNEAIGNVLGVPLEILGFTDFAQDDICTFVHRSHATPRLSQEELLRRLDVAGQYLSNNADGDSIWWAFDRIRQRREKRKLMIVASDGSPASSREGIVPWTKEVVSTIEKSGIQIVGIGLQDNNVSRFYKEHYVIKNASELDVALLTLIDKKLR